MIISQISNGFLDPSKKEKMEFITLLQSVVNFLERKVSKQEFNAVKRSYKKYLSMRSFYFSDCD